MPDNEAKLMKDSLGIVAVEKIADSLQQVWPKFDSKTFILAGMDGIDELELKARIHHLIDVLHRFLPNDFEQTAQLLIDLTKIWQRNTGQDSFGGFAIWPIIDYVGVYGLDHPEKSLDALEALTPLFSAEFAIRPFINQHFEITYKRLNTWVKHDNADVRRLVSEGIRPRLPWGLQLKQFIKDPKPVIALLEQLKDDDAEYVRRSVANNLNDISKDHPQLVVDICKEWLKKSSKKRLVNQMWIANRAARGLVKQGFVPVYNMLGYSDNLDIKIDGLRLNNSHIKMGEYLEFEFEISANKTQKFVLDYAIYFMKKSGKQAPKVFKLKNIYIQAGDKISIAKRQIFKEISTRKYYAGDHKLEILLNGKPYAMIDFFLEI